MNKDIEWLKNEIDMRIAGDYDNDSPFQRYVDVGLQTALDLIEQMENK